MTQEDFYKWLDECPVQWVYFDEDEGAVTYTFILPDTEDDD